MIDAGWYVAAWGADLAARPIHRRVANTPWVLYRRASGAVVALHDQCPHRSAPLSTGRVESDDILCAFHGLRVGPDGLCPDLVRQGRADAFPRVVSGPVFEQDGLLWLRQSTLPTAMASATLDRPPRMPWHGLSTRCDMVLLKEAPRAPMDRSVLQTMTDEAAEAKQSWCVLTPHTAQTCLAFSIRRLA
jgi:phenylpropionate dioxygenase-like ring-hydroxylating dioxygenase large terminal subunit